MEEVAVVEGDTKSVHAVVAEEFSIRFGPKVREELFSELFSKDITDSKNASYFSFPRTFNNSSRIWNSREGYPVIKFSMFIHPELSKILK